MSSSSSKKPHAIMINSHPFQGHINPFVNLALKLASKGIVVTFVHLQDTHRRLYKACPNNHQPDPFHQARGSGLDIRYTTMSDGFPLEFDRIVNAVEYWTSLIFDFPALVDEFVGKLIGSSDSDGLIHFLVADTCSTWPGAIAEKHNLVNVSFWTEPALVFTLLYHWNAMFEKGHVPCNDSDEEVDINYVPGVQSINRKDLMSYLKEEKGLIVDSMTLAFAGAKKADFVLHNIVHELEIETLSSLNSYKPNYAIGPISFTKGLPTSTMSKSLWSESNCTDWLDSKPPGSVLYVSFGSLVQIPKQVMEEIAYGLLSSEVNFLWVIRKGIVEQGEENSVITREYRDEMKDRGMIIPWCNQIEVLSSSAVGGFLTHNGWNSTIESMWCGVPMLCYPITFDQPTNRKLVVDDWKIGINLCNGRSVDRESTAKTINKFMSGSSSNKLRHEASRMKEIVQKALEIDGSSERNFNKFINELKEKISNRS